MAVGQRARTTTGRPVRRAPRSWARPTQGPQAHSTTGHPEAERREPLRPGSPTTGPAPPTREQARPRAQTGPRVRPTREPPAGFPTRARGRCQAAGVVRTGARAAAEPPRKARAAAPKRMVRVQANPMSARAGRRGPMVPTTEPEPAPVAEEAVRRPMSERPGRSVRRARSHRVLPRWARVPGVGRWAVRRRPQEAQAEARRAAATRAPARRRTRLLWKFGSRSRAAPRSAPAGRPWWELRLVASRPAAPTS